MKRSVVSVLVALALLVSIDAGAPVRAGATCAAPQAERARLVTPPLTQLPLGSGFVVATSEAVGDTVRATGPATFTLTGTEIAPHVLRFTFPASAPAGRYDLTASYRGAFTSSMGALELASTAPALAPPAAAPMGHIPHVERPGRWSPSVQVALTLASAPPSGIAVAFEWTHARTRFGNVAWVTPQALEAALGGTGHCGGSPFGAVLPSRGETVRAAFVDERGQLGPWGSFTVR